jgi:hypothetical protein
LVESLIKDKVESVKKPLPKNILSTKIWYANNHSLFWFPSEYQPHLS